MIEEIAKLIAENVFLKMRKKGITVFLVGAARGSSNSIREAVRKELIGRRYLRWLDVYYPEELFEELLGSSASYDLLSLENLLARSVHSVVILLESPGAIAELGAFSNHSVLRNRLVVVVDEKYRRKKSFIMVGPVRYLKNNTESRIIYHNLRKPNIDRLGMQIRSAVRSISKNVEIDKSVANPIAAQNFLLATIFVLEPIRKELLWEMVKAVQSDSLENVITIVTSALNILLREKDVILQEGKYRLTENGLEKIQKTVKLEAEGSKIRNALDEIRVMVLNSSLRGKQSMKSRERVK